ncbi:uncharacterized protein LOC132308074 isoform X2 [Cornus florida]|uniref:uncharacterized protein LOC132308074 isoform X2 n=1 Tax=Cornus florida TaxID=4283 RepID=UPI00289E55AF|nr:uncharacterized protein LOC132308074 isoform X2 [Cornus florida]
MRILKTKRIISVPSDLLTGAKIGLGGVRGGLYYLDMNWASNGKANQIVGILQAILAMARVCGLATFCCYCVLTHFNPLYLTVIR